MSAGMDCLLQARQVSLQAGSRLLLEGLDWAVRPGEFWCVLGRNGIGKSTLLHAAAGLLMTQAGQWSLQGQPLTQLAPDLMARWRGLLLQHQYDAFAMPLIDAVLAGRFVHHGGWSRRDEDRTLAMRALEQVGLAALAGADLLQLSGGERQRVALATLLAQDPALYLLDEPTSHQDIAAQLQIMRLLRTLAAQGKGVVASCHDINLASRFASHILLLGGQRRWAGPTAEVMRIDALEAAFACSFRQIDDAEISYFIPLNAAASRS